MDKGLRFGTASAVASSLVLLVTLRPISRFRSALVAGLLTIALVDSMADAYAIWNAKERASTVGWSLGAKVIICASLAFVVARGSARSKTPYVLLAAFVGAQLLISASAHELWKTAAFFGAASVLALALNATVVRRYTSVSASTEDSSSEDSYTAMRAPRARTRPSMYSTPAADEALRARSNSSFLDGGMSYRL